MQNISVFLSFVFMLIYSTVGVINLVAFQQQALAQHNYYRQQLHCTAAMTLNSSLNTIAQNYAQYLATNNIFNHSQTPGLGENLWMAYSSGGMTFVNGSTPTTDWYNEITLYNFSSPGFSSATGHFTQVVWSDSIQLGIGIALTSNNLSAYTVANYYPPGNYLGQFATKVPTLCTSTTSAGTTSSTGSTTNAGSTSSTGSTVSAGITSGGTTSSTRSTVSGGSTTSAIAGTNSGATMSTTTSNNTAVNPCYRRYHLLVPVVILGTQFYQFFD